MVPRNQPFFTEIENYTSRYINAYRVSSNKNNLENIFKICMGAYWRGVLIRGGRLLEGGAYFKFPKMSLNRKIKKAIDRLS